MTSDPLHLDAEALAALAPETEVRRGLQVHQEHRVTELTWTAGEEASALVEGAEGERHQTSVWADEEGQLRAECTCESEGGAFCRHVIAVLLAYASRQPTDEEVAASAAEEAIQTRAQRGRTEVKVRHVSGDRWFGTWEARSLAPYSQGTRRVQIRSVSARVNHCTCPDFAINALGTCKHIEAVLHKLQQRAPKKFARYAARGPRVAVVALDWGHRHGARIGLERPSKRLSERTEALLDRWFAADGSFSGRLPEGWHALVREGRSRDDLLLGDDVEAWVTRLEEEAVREQRARAISEEVRGKGAHIPGVRARLHPYQVEGVGFLVGNGRSLLADDMGLGKTLQAIAACHLLTRTDGVRRILVVCPASLKHHWAREIEKFTDHSTQVVQGPATTRLAQYAAHATFTIVNYELVLRDHEAIQRRLAPDVLVLDEAQRIKNWRTKTATAVKRLETPYAMVLTGTPLENRLEDLYSLMQVVDPRVLGPLWRLSVDFMVSDDRGKVLGYRNLAELRRRLAPVMLRRDRRLVRDQLPDRTEVQRDITLDKRQRDLHDASLSTAVRLAHIASKRPLTPMEEHRLMAALQNARMACDAAGLVDKETVGSPKLDELRSLLEELCVDGDHKVVVFSQWERMTAMAAEVCDELGLGHVRLHGGVPTAKRGALLDAFAEQPETRVFLSTDAGGVGLNLQAADVLVNLDVPWNPAVLDQRVARVHRLGQRAAVQVFFLVASDSYEQSVAALVEGKRALFTNVVEPEATEDVVGIDKSQVRAALESLAAVDEEAEPAAPTEEVEPEPTPAPDEQPVPTRDGQVPAESLASVVAVLQTVLGSRLEQVVAAGGGLVAVVSAVAPEDEDAVAAIASPVPLVLLDRRAWRSLQRLSFVEAGPNLLPEPAPGPHPSVAIARRKLEAAHRLVEVAAPESVGHAAEAMLHALAVFADEAEPPVAAEAPLWLYGTLVPGGSVGEADAGAVARALALRSVPEVPLPLVRQVLEDASSLVARAVEVPG